MANGVRSRSRKAEIEELAGTCGDDITENVGNIPLRTKHKCRRQYGCQIGESVAAIAIVLNSESGIWRTLLTTIDPIVNTNGRYTARIFIAAIGLITYAIRTAITCKVLGPGITYGHYSEQISPDAYISWVSPTCVINGESPVTFIFLNIHSYLRVASAINDKLLTMSNRVDGSVRIHTTICEAYLICTAYTKTPRKTGCIGPGGKISGTIKNLPLLTALHRCID
jgi:hypothetical protein